MKSIRIVLALLLLLVLAGCESKESYMEKVTKNRKSNDDRIQVSSITPFTAIAQTVLQNNSDILIKNDTAEDHISMLTVNRDYEPDSDVNLIFTRIRWYSEEKEVFYLENENDNWIEYAQGDTIITGKYLVKVYYGNTGGRVMVFDPGHKSRNNFEGLNYFPPSENWIVKTSATWYEHPDTVVMTTSLGLQKYYLRAALLKFEIASYPCELSLFTPASDPDSYGFIPFTDKTTGVETYGGGRYIDIAPLEYIDEIILDFNKVYNPYCAYTAYYNCPVPPPENHLPVSITAGEKVYYQGH